MKIIIVPHNMANLRTINIRNSLILLLFLLVLIPLIARFFYPGGSIDSSKLEQNNKHLQQNLIQYEREYEHLTGRYEVLLSKAFATETFNKRVAADLESIPDKATGRIDDLLAELEISRDIIKEVELKLQSNSALAQYTPSILPTKGYITQTYGKTEYIFTDETRVCQGIDIAASEGSKVYATASGTVEFAGFRRHSGLMIKINNGYGFKTVYSHLSFLKVRRYQFVKRGDEIGLVGKTGKAIGPMLHYEVWVNGKPKNPIDYIIECVDYF